jgi:hypothetical protein
MVGCDEHYEVGAGMFEKLMGDPDQALTLASH